MLEEVKVIHRNKQTNAVHHYHYIKLYWHDIYSVPWACSILFMISCYEGEVPSVGPG